MHKINIMNHKTFHGFTFSYENLTIETIDSYEVVEIYSNITIIESNVPKFKKGDFIEQISIECKLHFEHEDGTPY